jgi:hypothetical protein
MALGILPYIPFDQRARASILAVETAAERALLEVIATLPPPSALPDVWPIRRFGEKEQQRLRDAVLTYAETAVLGFAKEACSVVRAGHRRADMLPYWVDQRLRALASHAYRDIAAPYARHVWSEWNACEQEVTDHIHRSPGWHEYLSKLENAAKLAISVERVAHVADDVQSAKARTQVQTIPVNATDNRFEEVEAFLLRCNQQPDLPVRVQKAHLWLAARHRAARQFQYWQSGNSKATRSDDQTFRGLLALPPAEFIARLRRMGLLKDPAK